MKVVATESRHWVSDLLKSKPAITIISIIAFIILIVSSTLMFIDMANNKPFVWLWGAYRQNPKDSFIVIQHDTVYKYLPASEIKSPTVTNIKAHEQTNVSSQNQKGGQTAGSITNDNK